MARLAHWTGEFQAGCGCRFLYTLKEDGMKAKKPKKVATRKLSLKKGSLRNLTVPGAKAEVKGGANTLRRCT